MKILSSILILQLIFISSLFSQKRFIPSKDKLYQSLIGEVYMLTLFVDTQYDTWEDSEMEYYLEENEKSQSWLVEQAKNYDQDLEFNNDYFFKNYENIYIENVKRGAGTKKIVRAVMEELGYDDFEEFCEDNDFDFSEKKLKILLFVKSNDRSHAYNKWSNKDVDLAIVYCRSTYGMKTDHYVISHEVLHQFGAWDLYQGRSQSVDNAKKLKELYPKSIMISTYGRKEKEVDELTAFRVGWHYDFKEEYKQFNPDLPGNSASEKRVKSYKFDMKKKNENDN